MQLIAKNRKDKLMKEVLLIMSTREINRAGILKQVQDKKLTQVAAAKSMNLSDRQLRRLMVKYRANGATGIVHSSRGRPSNHQLSRQFKDRAIELVRIKYPDFGPTFASEKLAQLDGLVIGHETLRKLMIAANIWQHKKRKPIHRTRRERRACYGDMEQFDGCYHDWFEGRLVDEIKVTLLASRDDATNTVRAQFVNYEGTAPVMAYWRDYIKTYGKPQNIYLDRHSTYKINSESALDDDAMLSQFERAMKQLGIMVIHANSPQAKGRIENLFGTLQDRLVKELRLANISDIATANQFLQSTFLPDYNKRFCVTPASEANIHCPLLINETLDLDSILSIQSKRTISNDFTIRFHNQWFQLTKTQPILVLPKQQIVIEERLDDSTHIRLRDKYLTYNKLDHKPVTAKKLPIALTSNIGIVREYHKPATNHPWRNYQINTRKAITTNA